MDEPNTGPPSTLGPIRNRDRPAAPEVVYADGLGHSGSTILGIALGNCERFFYAGEFARWLGEGREAAPAGPRSGAVLERRARAGRGADRLPVPRGSARAIVGAFRPGSARGGDCSRRYRRVSEQLSRAMARASGATHVCRHVPLPAARPPVAVLRGDRALRPVPRARPAERRSLLPAATTWDVPRTA